MALIGTLTDKTGKFLPMGKLDTSLQMMGSVGCIIWEARSKSSVKLNNLPKWVYNGLGQGQKGTNKGRGLIWQPVIRGLLLLPPASRPDEREESSATDMLGVNSHYNSVTY